MIPLIVGNLAALVVCAAVCWRVGYFVGREDGKLGVSAPWPWSGERYDSEEATIRAILDGRKR